jgi:type II secretory pathway component PulF
MKFSYRAFDKSGKSRAETIEAASVTEATEQLRRQGLFVSEIRPATEAAAAGAQRRPTGGGGVRGGTKNLASFLRQTAVLVKTGTPLVDAIVALERQTTDQKWLSVISGVRARVEEGQTLSEAMASYPRSFDTVSRSLVRAGESGGNLGDMLTRLAELKRKQLKIKQQLVGAMVYPCVLIMVSIAVTLTMMLFVMPRFSGLFKSLDVPLPPTTRFLMTSSTFLISYWWAVLGGLVAVVGGLVAWARTPTGRFTLHGVLLNMPQVKRLVRGLGTARFARLMGVLLESRVPMLECLELTQQASGNLHYAALLDRASEALQRGEPLSSAIGTGGIIEASVCEAVKSGERTGQVGPVLSNMADFIEEQNEVVIKSMTSLIEPLILISLGLVVGLMATSMFLPLFDLTASAGGSGGGAP